MACHEGISFLLVPLRQSNPVPYDQRLLTQHMGYYTYLVAAAK